MARLSATLVLFCFTALSADEPLTAYLRRVGPYRVGMTLADMRGALKDPRASLDESEPSLEGCTYLDSGKAPKALGFMFANGRVVRIDIDEPGYPTASGVQVGDLESRILELYSDHIKIEPHPYGGDEDHYVIYSARDKLDRGYGMIFETWGGKITSYRVGKMHWIQLAEGCL